MARERVLWQLPRGACLEKVAPSVALSDSQTRSRLSQVVVDVFVGRELALLAFGGLALASRAWIWLAEHKVRAIQTPSSRANVEPSLTRRARHKPFGFPFVVALHAGADLGVVLIVSAMDLEWARRGATAAALTVSVAMSGAGAALLWKAWRRERLPPLPLCLDD